MKVIRIKTYKNNAMQQVDSSENKLFYKTIVLWGD